MGARAGGERVESGSVDSLAGMKVYQQANAKPQTPRIRSMDSRCKTRMDGT